MRKLIAHLAIFLAIFSPSAASAQSYDSGAAVTPTWSNSVPWTPPYDVDDTHPADTYEPAISTNDNVLYTRALWHTDGNQRNSVGTSDEAKFRTECKPTFTKRADPLLYPGQYPAGHGHTFFGPVDQDIIDGVEDFNYTMGRNNPGSACQGGPLNTTLYWEPSIYDERYGLRLVVMPHVATFYYTHLSGEADLTTRLRRNYRFIGGANPADYNDTARRAEYASAGLLYPGTPTTPAGFSGIECYVGGSPVAVLESHRMTSITGGVSTSNKAKYLKGASGEDPWDGACTAGYILILVDAPACWDGTNLSSPDGRSHVRYATRNGASTVTHQCPSNYVKVMKFATKIQVNHDGWDEDLQYWYMSSDRMRMPTAECPDETAPCDGTGLNTTVSLDPCRATGLDFCPFATAHFDWWGAWDDTVLRKWERNCGGLIIDAIDGTHADCGSGGIADGESLNVGAPPEPNLSPAGDITSLPTDRASDSAAGQKYFPVRADDQSQPALDVDVQPDHHS